MYLEHFGLNKEPFHITPDPFFFYMSPSHKESYASLIYGLKNRKGFVSLTGEVGLGKTTVIRTFLKKWSDKTKIKTVFVFNSNLSFKGLLLTIYSELGLDLPDRVGPRPERGETVHALPLEDEIFELVRELYRVLIKEYQDGYNIILVIDDAQNMPVETLENLRMLSNLETSTDKLIQIFLIGQTELDSILDKKELRQLRQRIAIRATLRPLSENQSKDYILHRLKKAGASPEERPIFTRGALKKVYQYSQGIPRKINIICDNALITGFGYDRDIVNSAIVQEVRADLEGRKPRKKWRYAWAAGLLMMLMAGGLWFSPFKDDILAGIDGVTSWKFIENMSALNRDGSQPDQLTEAEQEAETGSARPDLEPEPVIQGPEIAAPTQEDTSQIDPFAGMALDQEEGFYPEKERLEDQLTRPEPVTQDVTDSAWVSPENQALYEELARIIPSYHNLSRTRQEVLIRMARQTSLNGLLSFERMLAALERGDFQEASRQMVHSRWARTVGEYAYDLAEAMRTDEPTW